MNERVGSEAAWSVHPRMNFIEVPALYHAIHGSTILNPRGRLSLPSSTSSEARKKT